MEIYLFILIVLFILAISDLMVGVSNDAVNFLNSAVGSKVAPRHIILLVASLGIMVGVTFSSGLMEVARKGIFNPEMFYFPEIMIIFLAVMLTDVVLLDAFNTFGLPTSTTVSIVFELLGASVAVSIIKIAQQGEFFSEIVKYINTSKALAIISGILLSVVISFTAGVVIQFVTRFIFTFEYKKYFKWFGAIWGALALTAITYFILVKGAKGTSFLSDETVNTIVDNTFIIMGISILFWTFLFQIINSFTKWNILRFIVLAGTFALALAFAANDLVNFIGVPLAGLSSYNFGLDHPDPINLLMTPLKGKVTTSTLLLLLAGIVMVITLWVSKKARTVTKTEVNLGRQFEGYERFSSSLLSRSMVRMSVSTSNQFKKIIPVSFQKFLNKRFDNSITIKKIKKADTPAFDLIRASNNLMLASILISFATSLNLPLSTTYVTFMVAMGTSLADKAWGRDSAVYRVNGVLTVIGGWFFTAFSAFTIAAITATIIFFGGLVAIIILIVIVGFIIIKSYLFHKIRVKDEEESESLTPVQRESKEKVIEGLLNGLFNFFRRIPEILNETIKAMAVEDRIKLKAERKKARKRRQQAIAITSEIMRGIELFKVEELKGTKRFGKIISTLQDIATHVYNFVDSCFNHLENNHRALSANQNNELEQLINILNSEIGVVNKIIEFRDFENLPEYFAVHEKFNEKLNELDISQISRIKNSADTSKNSLLYLNLLFDLEAVSQSIYKLLNNIKNLAAEKQQEPVTLN